MTEEEFNNTFYGKDLISLTDKIFMLETKLIDSKNIEKEYKKAKDEIYEIFDKKGLISFETDRIKITKVSPTSYDTVTIDTKKLEAENPDIYDKYKKIKTTNRKGYILITNKEVR